MSVPRISIILPVYNQADHLESILHSFEDELKRLPHSYELLVVLNGCTDTSPQIAKKLAADRPVFRCLELSTPGWGAAVAHGLSQAKGEILCYTNCARTAPRDLVLSLIYATA